MTADNKALNNEYLYLSDKAMTTAVDELVTKIVNAGGDVIDLGQGSEKKNLSDYVRGYFSGQLVAGNRYHSNMFEEANQAWAGFSHRRMGLPDNKDQYLLVPDQGRGAYFVFASLLAQQYRNAGVAQPVILSASPRWSTKDRFLELAGFRIVNYDGLHPDPVAAQEEAIKKNNINPLHIAAPDKTRPDNPTGAHAKEGEYSRHIEFYHELGQGRPAGYPKIVSIHDDPYFYANYLTGQGDNLQLQTFYEELLGQDADVDVVIFNSFSKIFETANYGLCGTFISNPELMKQYIHALNATGDMAYCDDLMANVARIMRGDMDHLLMEHIAAIGNKYRTNTENLVDTFKSAVVLPHESNMTKLILLPADLLNRRVICRDGVARDLATPKDVCEYLINREKGVAVIPQGVKENGDWYLRFALKHDPETQKEGYRRVKAGLEEVAIAPKVAAPAIAALEDAHGTNGVSNGVADHHMN